MKPKTVTVHDKVQRDYRYELTEPVGRNHSCLSSLRSGGGAERSEAEGAPSVTPMLRIVTTPPP